MSPKITDPNNFLNNLVSKKGRSDLFGVYLTGVNVLADATEEYGYDVSKENIERDITNMFARDETDWNRLLVETRLDTNEIIFPISFHRGMEPVTVYFAVEGNEMSCMVFIPTLVVSEFVTEVTFFQHLLTKVAHFAGKIPSNIRFTLGAVSIEWDDMVGSGHAREVDIGY
jgi:hypothetical protein